jgi:hypothetical protein
LSGRCSTALSEVPEHEADDLTPRPAGRAFKVGCGTSDDINIDPLIQTDSDRSRFRANDDAALEIYGNLPGEERLIQDHAGNFVCKRLRADADAAIALAASRR